VFFAAGDARPDGDRSSGGARGQEWGWGEIRRDVLRLPSGRGLSRRIFAAAPLPGHEQQWCGAAWSSNPFGMILLLTLA
jgi:hypothetical protein